MPFLKTWSILLTTYSSAISSRLSVICCTLKVLTNMSLTLGGRASTLWRSQWKTEWDAYYIITSCDWLHSYTCGSDEPELLNLQLHGRKQHIRALLIDRVMLQHEVRFLEECVSIFLSFILPFCDLFISSGSWQWRVVSTGVFTRI